MKRAVIFDLDGTLLDTLADLAKAMNRVLAALGYPVHPTENYKLHVGSGLRKMVLRVLPSDGYEEGFIQRVESSMREEYAKCWHEETRPYDGIVELLAELERRGILLAVLSNKPHDFVTEMVDRLLPGGSFSCVYGIGEGIPAKPDPSGANRVALQLGLDGRDFLYLGDTGIDMKTASRAGMFSVGALWGFRAKEELLEAGARALIEKPRELLNYLGDA